MRFPEPLVRARLLRRYKRFLGDVVLDGGDIAVIHCPNPGAMLGLAAADAEVWLLRARSRTATLPYGWELTRVGEHLVGINTARPNALAAEAILEGRIPELAGYDGMRREMRYGRNSRIDLLLTDPDRPPCYVEVKNVHLKRGPLAEFPDCVTARGAKHLEELGDMVEAGARAVMLYIVQRADCVGLEIARDIDPAYGRALDRARARGVEVLCYACTISLDGIAVAHRLPAFATTPMQRA